MADNEKDSVNSGKVESVGGAVIFELDNVLLGGNRVLYDIVSSLMSKRGIKMTPVMFSRYCIDSTPPEFLAALLEAGNKKNLSSDALLKEFNEKIGSAFKNGSMKADSSVVALLKKASKNGLSLGALTWMEPGKSSEILESVDIKDIQISVCSYANEGNLAPSADVWMRSAKAVETKSAHCMGIAASSSACKACLSAGMRCVAVTDEFTSFQDFGGCDYVTDSLDKSAVDEIYKLLDIAE